jgi:hypothetical protein
MRLLAQAATPINIPVEVLGGINSKLYKALCWPLTSTGPSACSGATTGKLITLWLPNALVLAGIIFFFLIIGAGWQVIMGAGSEASAQDKAKAQAALTYAVIGFLLIVSAYFILQIIGVITGIDFMKPNI